MPQNKLTAVKIKQENGTYSPQIPIAAKVENIEYDKQYSVKDVLGTVNINKGPLQDQIDALPAQMTAEAVNNWMDNHVTAQTQVIIDNSLSTQGAAADAEATGELRKMIIINSETSPSDETKLRFNTTSNVVNILTTDDIDPNDLKTQIATLKNYEFNDMNNTTLWSQGAISSSSGATTSGASNTIRLCTIGTIPESIVNISVNDGYKYAVFGYTDPQAGTDYYIGAWNGTGFAKSGTGIWQTGLTDIAVLNAAATTSDEVDKHWYRVVLAYTNDAVITRDAATALTLTYSLITKNENDIADLKTELNLKTDELIKQPEFTLDGYLRSSNGTFIASTAYDCKTTDFIEITGTKIVYKIKMVQTIGAICFYDKNKNFLPPSINHNVSEFQTGVVDIPGNAVYYRCCEWFYSEPNQCIFEVVDYDALCFMNRSLNVLNDEIELKLDNYINVPFIAGGYISTTGRFVSLSENMSKVTDFILCHGLPSIDYKLMNANSFMTLAFYDQNKMFLTNEGVIGESSSATGGETFENVAIPSNAHFFRATSWLPRDDRVVLLNYPMEYIAEHLVDDSANFDVYLYGDSLKRSFDLSGKTAIAFGDSITAGVANEGSGNINAGNDAYIKKFASYANLTLTNRAKSGSTITFADDESISSVYTMVTSETAEADVIIISGGTNDYNTGKTVGVFGDNTKYTLYGALKLICEYLQTNYPNATVIFITPINVTKDFNGHPRDLLNLYRNAIFEVATYYGYNVVNGIDMVPVTGTTGYDDTMINHNDGCHPTIRGHLMYARNLCMKLL